MKAALVVGHKERSPGAWNSNFSVTEFRYNFNFVDNLIEYYEGDVELIKVLRKSYKNLPFEINALDPDFIISFHCNAFNKKVSGTETLYYYHSLKGMEIAKIIQNKMVHALKLHDRGIKPKTVEDRGGYLLKYTKAPCIIVEPFFIDNDEDLLTAFDRRVNLLNAFCSGIDSIAEYLSYN